jgi:hypothetical protein
VLQAAIKKFKARQRRTRQAPLLLQMILPMTIDRSRSRRMACLDCWVEFVVPSYCISLVDDWKIIRLVLDFWTIVLDF